MNFNRIYLKDGSEWACNKEFEGVFKRKSDGTFQQLRGTSQTPRFKDKYHFSRYIHKNFETEDFERLPKMIDSWWS
jgi:hypothetical protein